MINLTPEQAAEEAHKIKKAQEAEQEAVIAAERERTKRDEERKLGNPSPKIITPERSERHIYNPTPATPSGLPVENNFPRVNQNPNISHSRGTVILEGYYTIDDLKKYISLMEKYV